MRGVTRERNTTVTTRGTRGWRGTNEGTGTTTGTTRSDAGRSMDTDPRGSLMDTDRGARGVRLPGRRRFRRDRRPRGRPRLPARVRRPRMATRARRRPRHARIASRPAALPASGDPPRTRLTRHCLRCLPTTAAARAPRCFHPARPHGAPPSAAHGSPAGVPKRVLTRPAGHSPGKPTDAAGHFSSAKLPEHLRDLRLAPTSREEAVDTRRSGVREQQQEQLRG